MTRLGKALLVCLLAAAVAACGGQNTSGGGSPSGGDWPAQRSFLSTSVTQGGQDRPLVAGTTISLQFFDNQGVGASAGCNQLGGTGRLEDGRLVLGALSGTEMACDQDRMSQESWLADFLTGRPTWQLSGDTLVLRGGDVEIRLTDRTVADPDRSLIGTRWVVDTVITDGTASAVPSVEAYLQFDSETTFSGSTGCASLSGTTLVRGDKILFSSVMTSRRACADAEAALDRSVIGMLADEITYRIDGQRLTLIGPNGTGLGLGAAS